MNAPADGVRSGPLEGLIVVDLSTLLPGPLASLLLAEAGAEVIKIERPGGDEMRTYQPRIGNEAANFVLLNRGKRSQTLDLKSPEGLARVRGLIDDADVLIEQFRPGVMSRLGLSYEELSADNPGLIYCSITAYGQTGPNIDRAAHDLNFVAEAGMLSLAVDGEGIPTLPSSPVGDIAGGSYPAVINILLALQERTRTGRGRHLDVAMTDNVATLGYWAIAGTVAGSPPVPGGELVTGGSPRYGIYPTRDGRHLAIAPIEDRFWNAFCEVVGIGPDADRALVATTLVQRTADQWAALFGNRDVCVSVVNTIAEAMESPQFVERGVFSWRAESPDGVRVPALPVPLDPGVRATLASEAAPDLGPVRQATIESGMRDGGTS